MFIAVDDLYQYLRKKIVACSRGPMLSSRHGIRQKIARRLTVISSLITNVLIDWMLHHNGLFNSSYNNIERLNWFWWHLCQLLLIRVSASFTVWFVRNRAHKYEAIPINQLIRSPFLSKRNGSIFNPFISLKLFIFLLSIDHLPNQKRKS